MGRPPEVGVCVSSHFTTFRIILWMHNKHCAVKMGYAPLGYFKNTLSTAIQSLLNIIYDRYPQLCRLNGNSGWLCPSKQIVLRGYVYYEYVLFIQLPLTSTTASLVRWLMQFQFQILKAFMQSGQVLRIVGLALLCCCICSWVPHAYSQCLEKQWQWPLKKPKAYPKYVQVKNWQTSLKDDSFSCLSRAWMISFLFVLGLPRSPVF